jgi:hypothetical protein
MHGLFLTNYCLCIFLTPSPHSFCSIDDGFPVVTFSFEGDLTLNVYPHDYLFQNGVRYHLFSLLFLSNISNNSVSSQMFK